MILQGVFSESGLEYPDFIVHPVPVIHRDGIRNAPAERPCKMPPGRGGNFIPPGSNPSIAHHRFRI
jgi:hypothetical protein